MVKKITLKNGITVIYKKMDYVRSVSIGCYFKVGTMDETENLNGISHLIEHMLFKGTKKRNFKDIAIFADKMGGELNAFTSKELTCFYTTVLEHHLEDAIDILSDIIINPIFLESEIEKEKSVVLEELNLYEDSAEDLIIDIASEVIYKGTSLSLPIVGSEETLKNIKKKDILEYYRLKYTSKNLVISIAGKFDENRLSDLIEKYFSKFNFGEFDRKNIIKDYFNTGYIGKNKDIEVNHFNISFKGVSYNSDEFYPLMLLNNIVGGSVSSRLFQKIREDSGLVYNIESSVNFLSESGTFDIDYSTNDDKILELNKLLYNEIVNLLDYGITLDELDIAKEQLLSSYLLSLEDSASNMHYIGRSVINLGRVKTESEVENKIKDVSISDVNKIIKKVFTKNFVVASVGKRAEKNSKIIYEYFLKMESEYEN